MSGGILFSSFCKLDILGIGILGISINLSLVYWESVNLISYITVFYLLIENIARHV